MQQIANILYFLPCIVSLLWLIIYCFRDKVYTQRLMMALLALCIYYFMTYAFYISPQTDYKVMAILDVLNVPVILTILAIDAMFISAHHSKHLIQSRWVVVLFIPVFFVSSVNFLLYYILGIDHVANLFEQIDSTGDLLPAYDSNLNRLFVELHTDLHRYLLLAYIILIFILSFEASRREGYHAGNIYRFFFKGQESNATRVICLLNTTSLLLLMPLAGMGHSYLFNHPTLGAILSLLLSFSLFLLFYVEYIIDTPVFTLRSLSHMQLMQPQRIVTVREEESEEEELSLGHAAEQAVAQHPELVSALHKAFEEDQLHLDTHLSIQSLATHLSTNRTTLSLVIGQTYGTTFRQLVARYRIESAKKYMLANPDAKQEAVALECGFGTAQAFNQKFKEVEGDSPKIWLVKHLEA